MSYRPHLHFTPPSGWMNDPNGLVFHDGWWHLFYQHHPATLGWGPMHWGHARSRDLMCWVHLPIALFPGEAGAIWSGSAAVTDDGRLVACYTLRTEQEQSQCLAFSGDGGQTWEKYAHNPVLTSERADFRDPKIWRTDESWKMIVAAGPTAQIFSSPDLLDWSLESEFPAPVEGWIWECPDLFLLDGRWVLIGSFVVPGQPHETHYWLGDFDGKSFVPSAGPHRLSFGPDDYAAVSWNNAPDGRRVIMGWMNSWPYADKTPTDAEGFRGAMTLPRELSIREGKLIQQPVRELETLRARPVELVSEKPSLAGTMSLESEAFEIELEIEGESAHEQGLSVFVGEEERVWIGYRNGEIVLDRSQSCSKMKEIHPDFARSFSAPCALRDGTVKLRVFVDASSVEVFVNDGELYGAALAFPSHEAHSVEFCGRGTLWTLRGTALAR